MRRVFVPERRPEDRPSRRTAAIVRARFGPGGQRRQADSAAQDQVEACERVEPSGRPFLTGRIVSVGRVAKTQTGFRPFVPEPSTSRASTRRAVGRLLLPGRKDEFAQ